VRHGTGINAQALTPADENKKAPRLARRFSIVSTRH
jgi:hypothetical protein